MNNRDRPGKSKGAPLAIIRCRERTSAAGHVSAWRLGWLPVFDAGVNLAVAVPTVPARFSNGSHISTT